MSRNPHLNELAIIVKSNCIEAKWWLSSGSLEHNVYFDYVAVVNKDSIPPILFKQFLDCNVDRITINMTEWHIYLGDAFDVIREAFVKLPNAQVSIDRTYLYTFYTIQQIRYISRCLFKDGLIDTVSLGCYNNPSLIASMNAYSSSACVIEFINCYRLTLKYNQQQVDVQELNLGHIPVEIINLISEFAGLPSSSKRSELQNTTLSALLINPQPLMATDNFKHHQLYLKSKFNLLLKLQENYYDLIMNIFLSLTISSFAMTFLMAYKINISLFSEGCAMFALYAFVLKTYLNSTSLKEEGKALHKHTMDFQSKLAGARYRFIANDSDETVNDIGRILQIT